MKKNIAEIRTLYEEPFLELIHQAHGVHRANNDPSEIECCTLLNIKTGRCPEDCAYCPQSAHYDTGLQAEKLFELETVLGAIREAKKNGATRFCMGAAWRTPPKEEFPKIIEMIKAIKAEGLESCVTLGMLTQQEAGQLAKAGLDYYNHNLDSSPEFYKKIITTRTYQKRLETLAHVHKAGINICCGGILGMGESREDRIQFLWQLTQLPTAPKSIPLNQLIPIPGTPLEDLPKIDPIEFLRTVAVTRLLFPRTRIRLSAGRESMSDEMQAFAFFIGANSIHLGEKLLVTNNVPLSKDQSLMERLGAKIKRC